MSKKEPARSPPAVTPVEEDELPIGEGLVLVKMAKGWCVVTIRTQGERIIEKDIYSGPEARPMAQQQAMIALVKHVLAVKN